AQSAPHRRPRSRSRASAAAARCVVPLGSSSLLAAVGGGSVHPLYIQEHPVTRLKASRGKNFPFAFSLCPDRVHSEIPCAGRRVRKLTFRLPRSTLSALR